jgi:hypothetical protein
LAQTMPDKDLDLMTFLSESQIKRSEIGAITDP